jgi:hypothetical protein
MPIGIRFGWGFFFGDTIESPNLNGMKNIVTISKSFGNKQKRI